MGYGKNHKYKVFVVFEFKKSNEMALVIYRIDPIPHTLFPIP